MKEKNCPSCVDLGKDCGGHWSRRVFPNFQGDGRKSRTTMDTYDAAFLADNADYSNYEDQE